MTLLEDGMPIDRAAFEDWQDSISKSQLDEKQQLTLKNSYQAMINYLAGYCDRTNSDEIKQILKGMTLVGESFSTDDISWKNWLTSVNKVESQ